MSYNIDDVISHLKGLAEEAVFTPNDQTTRDELKYEFEQGLDMFMVEAEHLRFAKRTYPVDELKLYDYSVVCDESNNSPSVIDNNELKIDIAIKQQRTADYIFIPLTLRGA